MTTEANLPLSGLLVLAIEQAVAAPYCTARLADAGARVLKIERPEGDFARGYDDVALGQSSYFVWLNRGKESVVCNLASPDGKRTICDLVTKSDVVVQNLKPGALERLALGAAEMRRLNPGVIICSISGFGETGPMANRKAYDLLVQAESGLSSLTGGEAEPARVGISIVDIATGATAHAAVLEALLLRSKTGEGSEIQISMFDVMADWLTVPLLHQQAGKSPRRQGLSHPSIAPYGAFTTRDGKLIIISIQSDREWARFCADFLGKAGLASDERFATNVARVRNRQATDRVVSEAFAALDEQPAIERLVQADVACASVNDMEGLSRHPHLRTIAIDTPNGPVSLPAPAPIFVGRKLELGPVPSVGEHGPLPAPDEPTNPSERG